MVESNQRLKVCQVWLKEEFDIANKRQDDKIEVALDPKQVVDN